MYKTHARNGFTLIEILIAVAIVAIMAGGSLYFFNSYRERARRSSTVSSLRVLSTSIEQFNTDTNEYPKTLRDLITRPTDEKIAEKWIGPYIQGKNLPKDGWGREFHYAETTDAEHPYELWSYGSKGKGGPKTEYLDVWKL